MLCRWRKGVELESIGEERTQKSPRALASVCSVGHEQDFQFKPQDEDWGRIEGVYPFLKIEDREPIARLVAEYLRHDSYERYAPFLNDGMGWLDRTEQATKAFHQAITELPSSPEQLGALYAARSLVERRIQHRALPDGLEWHTIQGIMLHVMAAFDAAKSSLPTQAVGGFVEGQAWDVWGLRVVRFRRIEGLSYGGLQRR